MSQSTYRLVVASLIASYLVGVFVVYVAYMKKADQRYNGSMDDIDSFADALLKRPVIIEQAEPQAIDG